ncbi:hypothetical protein J8273_6628 [Carpediemonas membranifera]|uniref:Uncharacterized protein n=1 Tax=Carpediemonas membranifera TaxID=201153 RepID=A0A8J6B872_9EUKA|nr:hypothetical protein J8273_6628 [Carpediemonas membranifera]|eukprot:KAG9392037.1 hypothetical protein J8273_6628 [Carpediemonas membranifera]
MPKKGGKKKGKKKGKKGKKSKKESGPARPPFSYEPVNVPSSEIVLLHIRLVSWSYLDFTIRVPVDTSLFLIRRMIQDRHGGSINGVVLYKKQVHPENIIYPDDNSTLRDHGYAGSNTGGDLREGVIYYDFKPDFLPIDKREELETAPSPRLHPQGSPYMTSPMWSAASDVATPRARLNQTAPFTTPAYLTASAMPAMKLPPPGPEVDA